MLLYVQSLMKIPWVPLIVGIQHILVAAILLEISPRELAWRASTWTVSRMFELLDLGPEGNMVSLVKALKNCEYHLRISYCLARFDNAAARHLVAHFMRQPGSHPIMLPFELFSLNPTINKAVGEFLELYRPGSLMTIYEDGLRMVTTQEQIAAILRHQGDPLRYLSNSNFIQWADKLQLVRMVELGSTLYNPETCAAKLALLGRALTPISILYDAVMMREAADVLPRWYESLEPDQRQLFVEHIYSYTKAASWLVPYQKIVQLLEAVHAGEKERTKRLLWIGKALICLINHPHTAAAERTAQAGFFLSRNQLSHIPRLTILSIRTQLRANGLYITPQFVHIEKYRARFAEMDRLLPMGPRAWGTRDDFFSAWHELLRYYGQIITWDLPCKVCTVEQVLAWWADFDGDLMNFVLIDAATVRPFLIEASAYFASPATTCGEINCALRAITRGVLKLLPVQTHWHTCDTTGFLSRVTLRTIAANLLYRRRTGSTFFDQLAARVYDNESYNLQRYDDIMVRGLQHMKIDYVPKQMLLGVTEETRETTMDPRGLNDGRLPPLSG